MHRFIGFALVLALVASASVAGAAPAPTTADVSRTWHPPAWLLPNAPGMPRERPPVARRFSKRPHEARNTAVTGWTMFDLGMPAGLQDPVPYAVNQRGDVALQYCPMGGCTYGSSGTWFPYLYDSRATRLVPLARFGKYAVEQYYPQGLNDHGTIVGFVDLYDGTAWSERPVVWNRVGPTGSTIAFLDARAGYGGRAYAVNESGVIVGTDGLHTASQVDSGFAVRFDRSGPVTLSPQAQCNICSGAARGVNDAGVPVGDLYGFPFIFDGPTGTFVPFSDMDSTLSATAVAIDRKGNVAGTYYATDGYGSKTREAGFLYDVSSRSITQITPNYTTVVTGMNDFDEVVGYADTPYPSDPTPVGPFFAGSLLQDLLPTNATLSPSTATALNDHDQIVGQAYGNMGLRAYLLQPTPLRACKTLASPTSCR